MKRIIHYIGQFFYVAINWNLWLACFTLYHDIRGGIKYGINTFRREEINGLTLDEVDLHQSSAYEAVNYFLLEDLLDNFRQRSGDRVITDLGCGKGRVLIVAAHFGFRHIKGIDVARKLCQHAEENVAKWRDRFPEVTWTIIHANVMRYKLEPEESVFFMFNPFKKNTVQSFMDHLRQSTTSHPRDTWIIYASPQHADVFLSEGYHIAYQKNILNLHGVILHKHAF